LGFRRDVTDIWIPTISAKAVDPRDTRWELKPEAYRVYFWGLAALGMYTGEGQRMFASYEYELMGAPVSEVLLWAKAKAEDRSYTVYAVVNDVHRGTGLLHLFATDPTSSE
jgi:hypothetical protein